ncbi:DUF945 domain-containing protein [Exilibacterium tricleocarpae]|uniref:DUF945 domain-containing protein n=1 Tax=Exilibacterium tricleocarpae TaxID=2591008 RepID=A0A545TAJ1_9GAMM|nr:DUF945 family protein [Exilibacterium tricleocarpae]TQV74204.1 DUF945 domain-containing protein [Exilibacterium tricleocarpae]
MKKTVAYAALLLIAAGLIGPKFIGASAKERVDTYVEALNSNTVYKASWKEYRSGWFESGGTLQFELNMPALAAAPDADATAEIDPVAFGFDAEVTMQHGPVLTREGFALGLVNWQLDLVQPQGLEGMVQWDESLPLYSAAGQAGLFGDMRFSEQIPALKLQIDAGAPQFDFSGYTSGGTLSGGQVEYRGSSRGMSTAGPEGGMEMGAIDVDFTAQYDGDLVDLMAGALYDMQGSVKLASIKAAGDEPVFDLQNLVMDIDSILSDNGDLADIKLGYAAARVTAGDTRVTDAGVDIIVENYSAEFNKRYTKLLADSTGNTDVEQIQAQMQTFMQQDLLLLLRENPELKLENLRFSLPEGEFKGRAQIKLDGITELPADPNDPEFWLQHIVMSANLAADNALAERIAVQFAQMQLSNNAPPETTPEQLAEAAQQQGPMMLGMFGQQGILVQQEGQYRFDFSYNKGESVLNGNPIDLPIGAILSAK